MKGLLYAAGAALGIMMFSQCSDWTEMENKFEDPYNNKGEAYYQQLRAYKQSEHPVMFGWFSGWTGEGANMYNMLRGMPDSMDIVSLWGGSFNLTKAKLEDLREVREVKGTRILYCQHITDIGRSVTPEEVEKDHIVNGQQYGSREEALAAYWGWYGQYGDTSAEGVEAAIRKYARVIVDSINKYDYDGFDIDYEPNYGYGGNISSHAGRMHILLDELSNYLGPKSGTGRILMVDGEPQTLNSESGPLLDYYTIQAYYCTGDNDLDKRFQKLINTFAAVTPGETPQEKEANILKKTIWCEDFEKHKSDGGPEFTTRDKVKTYSLKGMAMYYRPGIDARIGGAGAYRFDLCRPVNDYAIIREVIQTMNPAQAQQ